MNILFVLYGDFSSNSSIPLALYARELSKAGHLCVITVPLNLETVEQHQNRSFTPVLYETVLADPFSVFPNGRPADVIHACTPREYVRRFVTSYQSRITTPLIIALEDNERWITEKAFDLDASSLNQLTNQELSEKLLGGLSHPGYVDSFTGLADSVVVVQDKLKPTVPPWVPCETVMIGIDFDLFTPRLPDITLRNRLGIAKGDKVIVYHGGFNKFVRESIKSLCVAVGIINQRGMACKLLRTGPMPLDFRDDLSPEANTAIIELGVVSRSELPDLLALADVFVQPGSNNSFEDLRLSCKLPEFLAMGKPVVMPDVNITYLFKDHINSCLLKVGSAEEIAEKCMTLFSNPDVAEQIGKAGKKLAEQFFDAKKQSLLLEQIYLMAIEKFDFTKASEVWKNTSTGNALYAGLLTRFKQLQISGLSLVNQDANKMMVAYNNQLGISLNRINDFERRITNQNAIISNQNAIISNLLSIKNELECVLESTSWKLTRPLRILKKYFDHSASK